MGNVEHSYERLKLIWNTLGHKRNFLIQTWLPGAEIAPPSWSSRTATIKPPVKMYNRLQQQCGDGVIYMHNTTYDYIAQNSRQNLTQARITMKWEVSHEYSASGRCGNNFKNLISEHMLRIKFRSTSCEIARRCVTQSAFNDKLILV